MNKLELIPQPQKVSRGKGVVNLPRKGTLAVNDVCLFKIARRIVSLAGNYEICMKAPGLKSEIEIKLDNKSGRGGYRLSIGKKGIVLEAASEEMAFYGACSLKQIAMERPKGEFPLLKIDDWPDFRMRGVYYDLCRGRVPRMENMLEMVEQLARYKINHLQFYIEHTFRFRGHPLIGKGASPLTAEDIVRLDEHCASNYIEFVPSLSTFGHMSNVLSLSPYRHLAEDRGTGDLPYRNIHRHVPRGWTISPSNPASYDFLDSLFAEFLPLFRSKWFNVCCDETWDLGMGQTAELCRRKGKGKVYLEHVLRLRDMAAEYGKRIMFWGDIIRKYPELIKEIPDDVMVLDWAYDHHHQFATISDFADAGLPFMACCGTGSWNALFPRWPGSKVNIHGFAASASENGGNGLLNTDWGDGGHYNFMEFSWPGYLFGAEQSWNVGADTGSFEKRFCKLFLGSDAADLVNAFRKLGDEGQRQIFINRSLWLDIFFAGPNDRIFSGLTNEGWISSNGCLRKVNMKINASLGRSTAAKLRKARKAFVEHRGRGDQQGILRYWIFSVDTIIHAADKLAAFAPGGQDTALIRRNLRREMRTLMTRFEKLWMKRNRRSEIVITLQRYRKTLKSMDE